MTQDAHFGKERGREKTLPWPSPSMGRAKTTPQLTAPITSLEKLFDLSSDFHLANARSPKGDACPEQSRRMAISLS